MLTKLKKGDYVARPGTDYRLIFMGAMWLSVYVLELETNLEAGGELRDATHNRYLDADTLRELGYEYGGNVLEQMELF